MYGYQLQSTQQLAIRRSRIPNSTQRNKCVQRALRYFEDTHPSVAFAPAKPFADRLKEFQFLAQETLVLAQNGATEKEIQKQHNAAHRALTGKTEKIVAPNRPGTRTTLFYINYMVEQKLMQLAQHQPELFDEYTTGKRLVLPIFTSTRHLCKAFAADLPDPTDPNYAEAVTTMTASFRGKFGYYASLVKLGYLDRKENQTRFGNTEKGGEGQEVALYVNVGEWVFGWNDTVNITNSDLEMPSASFSDPQRGNSSLNSTIYGKEHKQKEADSAMPRVSSAPCGATDSVQETTLQELSRAEAPAPQPSKEIAQGARNEKLEKLSEESLKLMLSTVFNTQNAQKGLIRTNATTLLNTLSKDSIAICAQRLIEIYDAMLKQGTSITQTNIKIGEIVAKVANDLNDKNLRYIYAPEMWLRMDYEKGTLWNVLNPIDKTTTEKPPPSVPAPVEDTNITAWIDWLEEQGLDYRTIAFYSKKHGKKAIAQAAYFAQIALNSPQKPKIKTSVPQYLHGILKNLNPQRIHIQIANLVERNTPKIGHIWTKWCQNIEKNTNNRRLIDAFYAAKPLSMTEKEMVVQVVSMGHFEFLDSKPGINLFKQAMRETGLSFKISYELRQHQ